MALVPARGRPVLAGEKVVSPLVQGPTGRLLPTAGVFRRCWGALIGHRAGATYSTVYVNFCRSKDHLISLDLVSR